MQRRKFLMVIGAIAAITLSGAPVMAATPNIEMFGTTLKGAKRDQLRQVFKQGGMIPTREDGAYWVDLYDSNGVLNGAAQFAVGYVMKTDEFAYAQYTFPSTMNTGLVKEVIDLVASKYGQPSEKKGQYGLGSVTATWKVGKNMKIEVSRGWPDTTTYLSFVDIPSNKAMNAEMEDNNKKMQQQKAAAQSNAF